jgi:glycosyltransferase involved in cell wall biosynthesis
MEIIKHVAKSLLQIIKAINLKHASCDQPKVVYFSPRFPEPPANRTELAKGGEVKLTYLSETFPHHSQSGNIIYLVSGAHFRGSAWAIPILKKKGFKIVVNQDGVITPFAYGGKYKKKYNQKNKYYRFLIKQSDIVLYQSEFVKQSCSRFLNVYPPEHRIVYNAVDTDHFRPNASKFVSKNGKLRLFLIAADKHRRDRIETSLQTLRLVKKIKPQSEIIIVGYSPDNKAHSLQIEWIKSRMRIIGLENQDVTFQYGSYSRVDAPNVLNQADILLAPNYMDPCPNLVIEAMACGKPVAFSKSGGIPELVGKSGGVGAQVPEDWTKSHNPTPQDFAHAIIEIAENYEYFSTHARLTAEKNFGLPKFIESHREVFNCLFKGT